MCVSVCEPVCACVCVCVSVCQCACVHGGHMGSWDKDLRRCPAPEVFSVHNTCVQFSEVDAKPCDIVGPVLVIRRRYKAGHILRV